MTENDMHTLVLTLAYDGLPFSGFARQPRRLTVQGNLEEVLSLLFRRQIETVCAGRTDAGVHARGQVVSFKVTPDELRDRVPSLMRSVNALVDEHIAITAIQKEHAGFSARFDAKAREYRYFISLSKQRPVLLTNHVWHLGKPLDTDMMEQASRCLLGEHDFKSFCTAASAIGKPTKRRLIELSMYEEQAFGEDVVVLKVIGNSFLHSMVRTMVGTLVAVGLGKKQPEWIEQVLVARDRNAAGQNAPAHGLHFWKTYY